MHDTTGREPDVGPTRPRRTILVTSGRAGSSLLSAIMADAGTAFGLDVPVRWNRGSGAVEHPLAQSAGWLFDLAERIEGGRRYFIGYKYLADARVSLAKRKLKRLLPAVDAVKAANTDLWIPHLPKMGYAPQVIVPFRDPLGVAGSFLMQAKRTWPQVRPYYVRVNRNALLYLHSFGGCAIENTELIDPNETVWAHALAEVTGLDAATLLAARDRRLDPAGVMRADGNGSAPDDLPAPSLADSEVTEIYQALRALRGLALPPSDQAQRRLAETRGQSKN